MSQTVRVLKCSIFDYLQLYHSYKKKKHNNYLEITKKSSLDILITDDVNIHVS